MKKDLKTEEKVLEILDFSGKCLCKGCSYLVGFTLLLNISHK